MILGAIVAGYGDLTFDLPGYALTTLNCVVTAGLCPLTAAYLVYIASKSKETGLSTWGMMFYNNLLSIPLVLALVMLTEWEGLKSYPSYGNVGFQVATADCKLCFFLSSVLAFVLNYSIFLCSIYNSPLVTSVTGNIKALLQTIIGLWLFGDVKVVSSLPQITFVLLLGLFISSVASIWYSMIKYNQQLARTAAPRT